MSKGLSSDLLDALTAQISAVKLAVEIVAAGGTLRVCSGVEPVTIGSDVYDPRPIKLDPVRVKLGAAPAVRLSLDDTDGGVSAIIWAGGLAGGAATVYLMGRTEGSAWSSAGVVATGKIRRVRVEEDAVTCTVDAEQARKDRQGLMAGSYSCSYRFRGPLCGYAGADLTCAHTWSACAAKANTARYGGFRWAPTPAETIPWASGTRVGVNAPSVPATQLPPTDERLRSPRSVVRSIPLQPLRRIGGGS